jgi:hypothetical protein
MMTESRDEWIKRRAYAIWEEEGRPAGRDSEHWNQAIAERAAMEKGAPNGMDAKPKAKRKAPAKAVGNGAAPPAAVKRASPRKAAAAKL